MNPIILNLLLLTLIQSFAFGVEPPKATHVVKVNWETSVSALKTTPTLQVVVTPGLAVDSKIHKTAFNSLKELKADFVRFVPWYPFPRYAIAELTPGVWDTSHIDPIFKSFLDAQEGRSSVINFSTVPHWALDQGWMMPYSDNPNEPLWNNIHYLPQKLTEENLVKIRTYFSKLLAWYVHGPFQHKIDFWEVFNETDFEHIWSPQDYTRIYDELYQDFQKISPGIKLMGLSLGDPTKNIDYFEYFLNPANHKAHVPVDYISYHFYALEKVTAPAEARAKDFFRQSREFLKTVQSIEEKRKRLSPSTRVAINELGTINKADDEHDFSKNPQIDPEYIKLSAALFVHTTAELARLGIDSVGESQLLGEPGNYPSVTMLDWKTGLPNRRYWALKILIDHFKGGGNIIESNLDHSELTTLAWISPIGIKRALLVNQSTLPVKIDLSDIFKGSKITEQTRCQIKSLENNGITSKKCAVIEIELEGLGVSVIEF